MTPIAECSIPECVYNRASRCYAAAITIGLGLQPECVTFHAQNYHVPRRDDMAFIGACKASECRHNREFACTAERVYVGYNAGEIACLSFRGN